MNYFAPGIRELQRIFSRLSHRGRLIFARRRLAASETELGLLGWQQAEFDDETQQQVDQIQNVEREQGRLSNASADLARTLAELTEQRARTRADAAAQRQQLETERVGIAEPLAAVEQQLATMRKNMPDLERRLPQIDRDLRDAEALHTKLLAVHPQPMETRDELLRLRERLVALPNEKADLQAAHLRISADLQVKERQRDQLKGQLAAVDQRLRELKHAADAEDAQLATRLRETERQKTRLEQDAERLERSKLNPYREIGRVLADSNVAPLNQPHVLGRVRQDRFRVREHEFEIAQSLQLSSREDRTSVHMSLLLLGSLAFAVLLIIGVLL